MAIDQTSIRDVLKGLDPSLAHKAAETPDVREIYAPPSHADALDPNRALVVGNRGVGKSFWASVLAGTETRAAAAKAYPALHLDKLDVHLGFHEGASGISSVAPPATILRMALSIADDAAWIWRSVVLKALRPGLGPNRLSERVVWLATDPELYEEAIEEADRELVTKGRRALIVFDALDVMATDWNTIHDLTLGLARVALEMSSRRAIRVKMFMRRDQFNDMRRKTFSDFSKLRTAAVELEWSPVDLYGALFNRLWRDKKSADAIRRLSEGVGLYSRSGAMPKSLQDSPIAQEKLFAEFAGAFMGINAKRGRTYTWVPKHLADGHGETSLRSFLIALKEAAQQTADRNRLAIDRVSISQGVLKASDTRREEIKEDHPWVEDALQPLAGLTVPCTQYEILERWEDSKTIAKISKRSDPERPAAPIQLALIAQDAELWEMESALLTALEELGVIERRDAERVNVPDIFRVTAKIKRKGGLAPRRRV